MKSSGSLVSTGLAIALAIATPVAARAQNAQPGMGPGMMQGVGAAGMMNRGGAQGGMGQGMMGQGMMDSGMMRGGMMGPGMMRGGMSGGMTCPMMNSTMMRGMTGQGMMGSGMGAVFGTRVTPIMNLSVDDVRGYLDMRLQRLNNKRLKVGNVSADGATITAEIVTVDNSLVQRLKVDRHTGAIEYVE